MKQLEEIRAVDLKELVKQEKLNITILPYIEDFMQLLSRSNYNFFCKKVMRLFLVYGEEEIYVEMIRYEAEIDDMRSVMNRLSNIARSSGYSFKKTFGYDEETKCYNMSYLVLRMLRQAYKLVWDDISIELRKKGFFVHSCRGCTNYIGRMGRNNYFICAIHPYGWEPREKCVDKVCW